MIQIIEDFLKEGDFKELKDYIDAPDLYWTHSKKANAFSTDEHAFQFFHTFINNGEPKYDNAERLPMMVIKNYLGHNKLVGTSARLENAKANLFVRSDGERPIEMGYHQDIDNNEDIKTLLLYLQDSNGHTKFKETNEKVYSKRNRAAIFPAHWVHQTVSATDILFRTNLNINFEEIKWKNLN